MKKLYWFSVVIIISFLGCIKSSKNFESSWEVLKTASEIFCLSVPSQKNQNFIIEKFWFLQNSYLDMFPVVEGFLYETISFNGTRDYHYIDFTNTNSLNLNNAKNLELGINTMVGGVGKLGAEDYVLVIDNEKSSSVLQLRTLKDNVLKASHNLKIFTIVWANTVFVSDGIWLFYKIKNQDNDTSSQENIPINVVFIKVTSSLKLKIQNYKITFNNTIKTLALSQNQLLVVDYQEHNKPHFVYMILDNNGNVSESKNLNLELSEVVESWDIQKLANDMIIISYVQGDSLIGMSTLNVALLNFISNLQDLNLKWIKTKSLLNEHVSYPKILSAKNKFFVVIPKWIDAESILGVYEGDITGINASKAMGVFSSATTITHLFSHINQKDFYALLRQKQNDLFHYKLCKIK